MKIQRYTNYWMTHTRPIETFEFHLQFLNFFERIKFCD